MGETPSACRKASLAKELNLEPIVITNWYKNRNRKEKWAVQLRWLTQPQISFSYKYKPRVWSWQSAWTWPDKGLGINLWIRGGWPGLPLHYFSVNNVDSPGNLVFTEVQKRALEGEIPMGKTPSAARKASLARELNLEPIVITNWYKNRNRKEKWAVQLRWLTQPQISFSVAPGFF